MSEQKITIRRSAGVEIRSQSLDRANQQTDSLQTKIRRLVVLAMLYAFSGCLAVDALVTREFRNPDMWWHLSAGAWIMQHHRLPPTDPFSQYGAGKLWVAYNWLFEVMLDGFYRRLGFVGTAVFMVAIALAIGLALYQAIRKRMGGFAGPIALTGLGLILMLSLFSVRPWLFSVLFFVIEMDFLFAELADAPEKPASRRIWFLPLMFVLWANLHIQFIYGLAALGLAALTQGSEVVQGTRGLQLRITKSRGHLRLWAVTGLCFLATFVNPYFWRLYRPVVEIARDRVPLTFVSELMPPDFRSARDYIVILIVMAAAFLLGRVQLRFRVFLGAILTLTTLVSIRMVRDEWFALVVALLIIAEGCGKSAAAPSPFPLSRPLRLAAAVLGVLFIFAWAKGQGLSNSQLEQGYATEFPVRATELVLRQGYPGPLFNYFDYGGYLTWRLPRHPVYVDGRTNIYGGERIARGIATWDCAPGWKTDADLLSANLVIGPTNRALSSALKDDSRFQLVYEDAIATVFVRRAK